MKCSIVLEPHTVKKKIAPLLYLSLLLRKSGKYEKVMKKNSGRILKENSAGIWLPKEQEKPKFFLDWKNTCFANCLCNANCNACVKGKGYARYAPLTLRIALTAAKTIQKTIQGKFNFFDEHFKYEMSDFVEEIQKEVALEQ